QREIVRVMPGVAVRGRVVDPSGGPIVGARVLAFGSLPEPELVATTDAGGSFALDDVVPGLALAAEADGFTMSLAHPVDAAIDSELGIELKLGALGRLLVGRITRRDGTPSPAATA